MNKDNKAFTPTFKYYTRNGVTTSVGSARNVEILKTVGYNGPFLKPNPLLPIHPYSFVWSRANAYVKEIRNWSASDVSVEEGHAMSRTPTQLVFDPPQDYTVLYARALEKLNEKVRGGVDLSVDILQAGQLKRMFNATEKLELFTKIWASKTRSLRKVYDRAVGEERAIAAAKAISSQHLEYIYGIRPLVSSIFGAAEERIRYVNNKLRSVKVRANDLGYQPRRVFLSTVYGAIYRDLTEWNSKLSVSLGITYKDADPDWKNYTSLNPISIAWELLPYSFVVDWIYNIGGYLRAVETSLLYENTFDSGYRTNFIAITAQGDQKFTYTSAPTGFQQWDTFVELKAYERSILTSYPSLDRPILEVDMGSSRMLAAASLLAGFLGRRPPGPRVI